MARTTIIVSILLIAMGLGAYFGTGMVSLTAMIPAFVGLPLLVLGLLARNPACRMHAMHVAVMISLIGFLAGAGRGLMKVSAIWSTDPEVKKLPVILSLAMGAVCAVHVVLCVRSFIAARKARQAGG